MRPHVQIFRASTDMLKDDLQGLHCLRGGGGAGLHELVGFFFQRKSYRQAVGQGGIGNKELRISRWLASVLG